MSVCLDTLLLMKLVLSVRLYVVTVMLKQAKLEMTEIPKTMTGDLFSVLLKQGLLAMNQLFIQPQFV